jgi:hypothetical protein
MNGEDKHRMCNIIMWRARVTIYYWKHNNVSCVFVVETVKYTKNIDCWTTMFM